MDFLSLLVGAAAASFPQVLTYAFGARKDRKARELSHYEVRLAAARRALVSYEGYAEDVEDGSAEASEAEDHCKALAEPFGETFANAAIKAVSPRENWEPYHQKVREIKVFIADLERKVGVPPRPS